jgi:hypothetical protein
VCGKRASLIVVYPAVSKRVRGGGFALKKPKGKFHLELERHSWYMERQDSVTKAFGSIKKNSAQALLGGFFFF